MVLHVWSKPNELCDRIASDRSLSRAPGASVTGAGRGVLGELLRGKGAGLDCPYALGDFWAHYVLVEEVLED